MLRGFWVVNCNDDLGFPIVAETHKEAKKLGYGVSCEKGIDTEWVDLRVTLIKEKIDFSKYSKGEIKPTLDNLKKGIYGYLEGEKSCPRCGELEPEQVHYDKEDYGGFYCTTCEYLEKCPKCGKFTREESEPMCEDCMNKESGLKGGLGG